MAVYTPDQYQLLWKRRSENILAVGDRTEAAAAKYIASRARSMAPRKSGQLRSSIRQRKNTVRASGVSNDKWKFPYIHWVNQTPGFNKMVLNLKRSYRTGRFVSKYTRTEFAEQITAIYGSSPGDWDWTGEPRFFQKAVAEGRTYFKRAATRSIKRAVRVTT